MNGRRTLSTRLGMPMLAPEQLSEVELLKLLGDLQWSNMCDLIDCPSSRITNEAGERLYASFISIHLTAGNRGCLAAFQEGDSLFASSAMRFFAGQFLEGYVVFDREPLPGDLMEDVSDEEARARVKPPHVYLTNALVARVAGNERLKVYRPAGIDRLNVPETPTRPPGIDEHAAVLQTGHIAGIEPGGEILGEISTGAEPVIYPIVYENDMNGAGLFYFARYVAVMNYAERMLLRERMNPAVSHALVAHLSTEERKIFYFANAPHHDRVLVHATMSITEPGPAAMGLSPEVICPLEFMIRHDLYRESDGELMASSLVKKRLPIPRRRKAVHAEVARLKSRLRQG